MALPRDDWQHHWSHYGDAARRNPAQRLRRQVIRSLLSSGPSPARILDIGSGQGDLIADLRADFPAAALCGIDYSQSGVDIARARVPDATFIRRDLLSPEPPPDEFSGWATHAVCSEVLEHVDDPRLLLENAAGYLAPGCRVIVTVPGGPMSAFDRYIGHRKHYTVDALRQVLADAGLEPDKVTGVGFPFFNLYRLVVIQRGENLAREVATGSTSRRAAAAMEVFRWLFKLGIPESRWGWQLVAVAQLSMAEARSAR